MKQDNVNHPQTTNLENQQLEEQLLEDQQVNNQQSEDQLWAALLSTAADEIPADSSVVPVVLQALQLERQYTADGSSWAQYLSGAAQLQDSDFGAVQPALKAVRLERHRVRQWYGSIKRFIATAAAVAAVVAAVAVFSPSLSADPTEAYSAYQEAARGW